MKEKYESLSLATLKDLAKARGLKGISTMRKPELIERMLEEDRKEQTAENEQTISGTAEENTIPARPEPVAAEKTENTGSVSSPERREAPTRSRTIIRRNPEYRSNNYGRNENAGRQNSYNGENRPENFVKRTPVAKPVEVVPPAELRPEETEQPRTGAASENRTEEDVSNAYSVPAETVQLDSGEKANGILEVMPDGFGFIRSENYLPGENDIYVSPSQIRRFNLKTGDIIQGNIRIKTQGEKFSALLYVTSINGFHPSEGQKRYNFENMTPIFPDERLIMERPGGTTAMRIVDLISPIGKGQRGMIVSPPKAGKTTLLKDVAKSILKNNKDMHLIILLIDERPEEVTDIERSVNADVVSSTFDEVPENHVKVAEIVLERARRLVEHKRDVIILMDSITRLARAYNLVIPPSGRTLSGGIDPAAFHRPKRFFGSARNIEEGGSLTVLATALVETGSKMDDVIFEEFKGTGNMELVLDRKMSEKRIFPAVNMAKSGTRREELLLSKDELDAVYFLRKSFSGSMTNQEVTEQVMDLLVKTDNNEDFVKAILKLSNNK